MNIIYFFVLFIGLFAGFHFLWIPKLEQRLVIDRSLTAISRSVLLSISGIMRSIFLIASLTTLFIIITVFFLRLLGGATPGELTNAIETVRNWRSTLVGFGPTWGVLVSLFLILALVIHSKRRSKIRMDQAFKTVFETEYQRLEKLYDENKLNEIPATKEMQKIQEEVSKIDELLNQYDKIEPPQGFNAEEFRQELLKHSNTLKKMLKTLDIQRRIDLKLDPSAVELPKPCTKWEKLQTFFLSRGLVKNLNRSSCLVYILCLILLFPSLLGIYSGKIGNTLDKRVVELQNLKFNLEIQKVPEDLKKLKEQLGEPINDLSEEDEAVINEAAHTFEDAITDFLAQDIEAGGRFIFRASCVRNEILSRASIRSEGRLYKQISGSKIKSLNAVEREVIELNEKFVRANKEPRQIFKIVKTELKDAARRSPGFLDKLKIELKNFKRPASAREISHSLISHLSGNMIDGVGEGEIGRIVQQAIHDIKKPVSMEILYETQEKRFVINLLEGKSFEESLNAVKLSPEMAEVQPIMRTTLQELPINQINNKLRSYPPAVKANVETHVNLKAASEKIGSLRTASISSKGGISADYSEALSCFDDWFPGHVGAENHTPRARLQSKWMSQSKVEFSSGTPKLHPSGLKMKISKQRFNLGQSFLKLRASPRVGGVLIGRLPSKSNINFTDIDWKFEGSKIKLILMDSDGRIFKTIPHRMSILYHALNYAADGRPTAVTITEASPMVELKILLHPVLVDTAMGYRIIELDHFVNKYTGEDENFINAIKNVYYQHALYEIAWANRLIFLLEYLEKYNILPEEFLNLKKYGEFVKDNKERRLKAGLALSVSGDLANSELSPLTAKKEFYDQELVTNIIKAANKSNMVENFEQEIRQTYQNNILLTQKEVMEKWLTPPPEFVLCNGVREKEFEASPSQFLILEGSEPPQPFRFMLQVAYTSFPGFLPGTKSYSEDEEFYVDPNPWEFPVIKKSLHEKVLNNVQKNLRDSVILSDSAEFTLLQRFFRMAFNGQLGKNFPVEKLLKLVETIEPVLPQQKVRTLRWDARPGIVKLSESRINEENRSMIIELLNIRKELGIWKDEQQMLSEKNAPLPRLY